MLCSFVIFQGIRTSIAKKPYIFEIFQGWGPDHLPPPPPLDPPMQCEAFDAKHWQSIKGAISLNSIRVRNVSRRCYTFHVVRKLPSKKIRQTKQIRPCLHHTVVCVFYKLNNLASVNHFLTHVTILV